MPKAFAASLRLPLMYKGLRVDSGNEEEQTEKIIAKYKSLGIDPATKQVVYSNGLNIDRAIEIHKYCAGRVQDSYGVGTFLTCDVVNCKPMNIVVKLTRGRITELREWHDCVKTPREIFTHVEELEEYKLEVPKITLLAHELRKKGLDIPECILSDKELADALKKLV